MFPPTREGGEKGRRCDKITAPKVYAAKGGPKLRMITAYGAPSARIAEAAEADIILVGDSVANVVWVVTPHSR